VQFRAAPYTKMDEAHLARLTEKSDEETNWTGTLPLPIEGAGVVGVFAPASDNLLVKFYTHQTALVNADGSGPEGGASEHCTAGNPEMVFCWPPRWKR
jgi:hypothetical protein